ncbi:hypothetical protein EB796_004538 [Bugula neritina]|uniref:ornithine decarboxylase n=1 Tax=Bugula neritina TaxID=10212 RepID=A0A7J7KEQ4_BUGNE|nr:hypothetical protein EB796_004538 [Bugula neritina]
MTAQLWNGDITFVKPGLTMAEIIDKKIEEHVHQKSEDAFFMCDLGDVARKYLIWKNVFPRIKPFYAVKCNSDPVLLNLLALLGTGFDCASKAEIQSVLALGVSSDRIVYANPCKQSNNIRYAEKVGVDLMTFDNEAELRKIQRCFPTARLVLRILPPPTEKIRCVLGNKFGCEVEDCHKLFRLAGELGLEVVGVSFHVGSDCYDPIAFRKAVEDARKAFDVGLSYGFDMKLLDVGGGFPGTSVAQITIEEIAVELNGAIDEHFPVGCGVEIISEPGRFFAASAYTLTTHVIAKRVVEREGNSSMMMYYVNDGVYGSFNNLLYDHAEQAPSVPSFSQHSDELYASSIWGPTCDGLDKICEEVVLPELYDGDWIVFKDMGAYTLAAGSCFNGMPKPKLYYVAELNLTGYEMFTDCYLMSACTKINELKSGYNTTH